MKVTRDKGRFIDTHFLWLSVSVMPWADTLKCTMLGEGRGVVLSVVVAALATACGPVRDSVSTELRYSTLQARFWEGRREWSPVKKRLHAFLNNIY